MEEEGSEGRLIFQSCRKESLGDIILNGGKGDGVCPNVPSTSQIPLDVALDRSGPSDPDLVLVESCFDDEAPISGPSGGHDFKHCSAPNQYPLYPVCASPDIVHYDVAMAENKDVHQGRR
ncbi:hypothetical protein Peur_008336 [Populus x canadensis]